MSEEMKVHEGSGNVFTDTVWRGAEERVAKADLARAIRKELNEPGLKQTEAADLLGITQPYVSDLVRGKLARVSMERLYR